MSAPIAVPAPVSVDPVPRLALRPAEAAKALGVSGRTLSALIADRGSGIPLVRVGRAVLLPVRELQDWLAERAANGATR